MYQAHTVSPRCPGERHFRSDCAGKGRPSGTDAIHYVRQNTADPVMLYPQTIAQFRAAQQ